MTHDGLTVYNN